jgi:hypothetical protein
MIYYLKLYTAKGDAELLLSESYESIDAAGLSGIEKLMEGQFKKFEVIDGQTNVVGQLSYVDLGDKLLKLQAEEALKDMKLPE